MGRNNLSFKRITVACAVLCVLVFAAVSLCALFSYARNGGYGHNAEAGDSGSGGYAESQNTYNEGVTDSRFREAGDGSTLFGTDPTGYYMTHYGPTVAYKVGVNNTDSQSYTFTINEKSNGRPLYWESNWTAPTVHNDNIKWGFNTSFDNTEGGGWRLTNSFNQSGNGFAPASDQKYNAYQAWTNIELTDELQWLIKNGYYTPSLSYNANSSQQRSKNDFYSWAWYPSDTPVIRPGYTYTWNTGGGNLRGYAASYAKTQNGDGTNNTEWADGDDGFTMDVGANCKKYLVFIFTGEKNSDAKPIIGSAYNDVSLRDVKFELNRTSKQMTEQPSATVKQVETGTETESNVWTASKDALFEISSPLTMDESLLKLRITANGQETAYSMSDMRNNTAKFAVTNSGHGYKIRVRDLSSGDRLQMLDCTNMWGVSMSAPPAITADKIDKSAPVMLSQNVLINGNGDGSSGCNTGSDIVDFSGNRTAYVNYSAANNQNFSLTLLRSMVPQDLPVSGSSADASADKLKYYVAKAGDNVNFQSVALNAPDAGGGFAGNSVTLGWRDFVNCSDPVNASFDNFTEGKYYVYLASADNFTGVAGHDMAGANANGSSWSVSGTDNYAYFMTVYVTAGLDSIPQYELTYLLTDHEGNEREIEKPVYDNFLFGTRFALKITVTGTLPSEGLRLYNYSTPARRQEIALTTDASSPVMTGVGVTDDSGGTGATDYYVTVNGSKTEYVMIFDSASRMVAFRNNLYFINCVGISSKITENDSSGEPTFKVRLDTTDFDLLTVQYALSGAENGQWKKDVTQVTLSAFSTGFYSFGKSLYEDGSVIGVYAPKFEYRYKDKLHDLADYRAVGEWLAMTSGDSLSASSIFDIDPDGGLYRDVIFRVTYPDGSVFETDFDTESLEIRVENVTPLVSFALTSNGNGCNGVWVSQTAVLTGAVTNYQSLTKRSGIVFCYGSGLDGGAVSEVYFEGIGGTVTGNDPATGLRVEFDKASSNFSLFAERVLYGTEYDRSASSDFSVRVDPDTPEFSVSAVFGETRADYYGSWTNKTITFGFGQEAPNLSPMTYGYYYLSEGVENINWLEEALNSFIVTECGSYDLVFVARSAAMLASAQSYQKRVRFDNQDKGFALDTASVKDEWYVTDNAARITAVLKEAYDAVNSAPITAFGYRLEAIDSQTALISGVFSYSAGGPSAGSEYVGLLLDDAALADIMGIFRLFISVEDEAGNVFETLLYSSDGVSASKFVWDARDYEIVFNLNDAQWGSVAFGSQLTEAGNALTGYRKIGAELSFAVSAQSASYILTSVKEKTGADAFDVLYSIGSEDVCKIAEDYVWDYCRSILEYTGSGRYEFDIELRTVLVFGEDDFRWTYQDSEKTGGGFEEVTYKTYVRGRAGDGPCGPGTAVDYYHNGQKLGIGQLEFISDYYTFTIDIFDGSYIGYYTGRLYINPNVKYDIVFKNDSETVFTGKDFAEFIFSGGNFEDFLYIELLSVVKDQASPEYGLQKVTTVTENAEIASVFGYLAPVAGESFVVEIRKADNTLVYKLVDGTVQQGLAGMADAGEYTVAITHVPDEVTAAETRYTSNYQGGFTVVQAEVTFEAKDAEISKVYDGTDEYRLENIYDFVTVAAVLEPEAVHLLDTLLSGQDNWSAAFDNAEAGLGKTFTVTILSLNSGNFKFAAGARIVFGNSSISPRTLLVKRTDKTFAKDYDGTLDVNGVKLNGEDVSLYDSSTYLSDYYYFEEVLDGGLEPVTGTGTGKENIIMWLSYAEFNDKNAGTDKGLTFYGLQPRTFGEAVQNGNYTFSFDEPARFDGQSLEGAEIKRVKLAMSFDNMFLTGKQFDGYGIGAGNPFVITVRGLIEGENGVGADGLPSMFAEGTVKMFDMQGNEIAFASAVNAGRYTIRLDDTNLQNYEFDGSVVREAVYTVNKRNLEIVFDNASNTRPFNAASIGGSARFDKNGYDSNVSEGDLLSLSVLDSSGSDFMSRLPDGYVISLTFARINAINSGSYTVSGYTFEISNSDNFAVSFTNSLIYTVSKLDVFVDTGLDSVVYSGSRTVKDLKAFGGYRAYFDENGTTPLDTGISDDLRSVVSASSAIKVAAMNGAEDAVDVNQGFSYKWKLDGAGAAETLNYNIRMLSEGGFNDVDITVLNLTIRQRDGLEVSGGISYGHDFDVSDIKFSFIEDSNGTATEFIKESITLGLECTEAGQEMGLFGNAGNYYIRLTRGLEGQMRLNVNFVNVDESGRIQRTGFDGGSGVFIVTIKKAKVSLSFNRLYVRISSSYGEMTAENYSKGGLSVADINAEGSFIRVKDAYDSETKIKQDDRYNVFYAQLLLRNTDGTLAANNAQNVLQSGKYMLCLETLGADDFRDILGGNYEVTMQNKTQEIMVVKRSVTLTVSEVGDRPYDGNTIGIGHIEVMIKGGDAAMLARLTDAYDLSFKMFFDGAEVFTAKDAGRYTFEIYSEIKDASAGLYDNFIVSAERNAGFSVLPRDVEITYAYADGTPVAAYKTYSADYDGSKASAYMLAVAGLSAGNLGFAAGEGLADAQTGHITVTENGFCTEYGGYRFVLSYEGELVFNGTTLGSNYNITFPDIFTVMKRAEITSVNAELAQYYSQGLGDITVSSASAEGLVGTDGLGDVFAAVDGRYVFEVLGDSFAGTESWYAGEYVTGAEKSVTFKEKESNIYYTAAEAAYTVRLTVNKVAAEVAVSLARSVEYGDEEISFKVEIVTVPALGGRDSFTYEGPAVQVPDVKELIAGAYLDPQRKIEIPYLLEFTNEDLINFDITGLGGLVYDPDSRRLNGTLSATVKERSAVVVLTDGLLELLYKYYDNDLQNKMDIEGILRENAGVLGGYLRIENLLEGDEDLFDYTSFRFARQEGENAGSYAISVAIAGNAEDGRVQNYQASFGTAEYCYRIEKAVINYYFEFASAGPLQDKAYGELGADFDPLSLASYTIKADSYGVADELYGIVDASYATAEASSIPDAYGNYSFTLRLCAAQDDAYFGDSGNYTLAYRDGEDGYTYRLLKKESKITVRLKHYYKQGFSVALNSTDFEINGAGVRLEGFLRDYSGEYSKAFLISSHKPRLVLPEGFSTDDLDAGIYTVYDGVNPFEIMLAENNYYYRLTADIALEIEKITLSAAVSAETVYAAPYDSFNGFAEVTLANKSYFSGKADALIAEIGVFASLADTSRFLDVKVSNGQVAAHDDVAVRLVFKAEEMRKNFRLDGEDSDGAATVNNARVKVLPRSISVKTDPSTVTKYYDALDGTYYKDGYVLAPEVKAGYLEEVEGGSALTLEDLKFFRAEGKDAGSYGLYVCIADTAGVSAYNYDLLLITDDGLTPGYEIKVKTVQLYIAFSGNPLNSDGQTVLLDPEYAGRPVEDRVYSNRFDAHFGYMFSLGGVLAGDEKLDFNTITSSKTGATNDFGDSLFRLAFDGSLPVLKDGASTGNYDFVLPEAKTVAMLRSEVEISVELVKDFGFDFASAKMTGSSGSAASVAAYLRQNVFDGFCDYFPNGDYRSDMQMYDEYKKLIGFNGNLPEVNYTGPEDAARLGAGRYYEALEFAVNGENAYYKIKNQTLALEVSVYSIEELSVIGGSLVIGSDTRYEFTTLFGTFEDIIKNALVFKNPGLQAYAIIAEELLGSLTYFFNGTKLYAEYMLPVGVNSIDLASDSANISIDGGTYGADIAVVISRILINAGFKGAEDGKLVLTFASDDKQIAFSVPEYDAKRDGYLDEGIVPEALFGLSIVSYNGSVSDLPAVIRNAGVYNIIIEMSGAGEGLFEFAAESNKLEVTVKPKNVSASSHGIKAFDSYTYDSEVIVPVLYFAEKATGHIEMIDGFEGGAIDPALLSCDKEIRNAGVYRIKVAVPAADANYSFNTGDYETFFADFTVAKSGNMEEFASNVSFEAAKFSEASPFVRDYDGTEFVPFARTPDSAKTDYLFGDPQRTDAFILKNAGTYAVEYRISSPNFTDSFVLKLEYTINQLSVAVRLAEGTYRPRYEFGESIAMSFDAAGLEGILETKYHPVNGGQTDFGATVNPARPGTYAAAVSLSVSNAVNYKLEGTTEYRFAINKIKVSVSPSASEFVYGSKTDFGFVTVKSHLDTDANGKEREIKLFAIILKDGAEYTGRMNAGVYSVSVSVDSQFEDEYEITGKSEFAFTVEKRGLTLSINNPALDSGNEIMFSGETVDPGFELRAEDGTAAAPDVRWDKSPYNVGVYTAAISVGTAFADNYQLLEDGSAVAQVYYSLEITHRPISISDFISASVYDGTEKEVSFMFASGSVKYGIRTINPSIEIFDADGKASTLLNAGTYSIKITLPALKASNYRLAGADSLDDTQLQTVTKQFVLQKANISGAELKSVITDYNGRSKSVSLTYGTYPEGVFVTYEYYKNDVRVSGLPTDAGAYVVYAYLGGDNYNELTLRATLQINKAALSPSVLRSADGKSLTVTVAGDQADFEYSINGGRTWQTDSTFDGLSATKDYEVRVRLADQNKAANYGASSASVTVPKNEGAGNGFNMMYILLGGGALLAAAAVSLLVVVLVKKLKKR